MFKKGLVSIDTNGSLATNHAPAIVSLKSLHVQEDGTFELKSYKAENSFSIDATNISVSQSHTSHFVDLLIVKKLHANSIEHSGHSCPIFYANILQ